MALIETQLKTGSVFYSNFVTHEVEGVSIAVTHMTGKDADSGVLTEQLMVVADDELVFQKTLRIDANGNSDAVLDYGAKLGGATRIALQCSAQMKGGQMIVSSSGDWNGRDLAPSEDLFEKRNGMVKRAANVSKENEPMYFADGEDLPIMVPDARVARALTAFLNQLDTESTAVSRNSCVAGCTAVAVACALGCAALTGPGFALCGKGCVMGQSACVAWCAT